MKALIRREGETVKETDGIEGIDWITGAPLTNETWCGGKYTLVANYVEQADTVAYDVVETVEEEPEAEETEPEATVVIDGKTYTVSQLKQLLGE